MFESPYNEVCHPGSHWWDHTKWSLTSTYKSCRDLPNLQKSWRVLMWQGTGIVVTAMATRQHVSLNANYISPLSLVSCSVVGPTSVVTAGRWTNSLLSGTQFIKGWWAHYCDPEKIIFAQTLNLIIQSGHNFAHFMLAQLSWHVHTCDLFG